MAPPFRDSTGTARLQVLQNNIRLTLGVPLVINGLRLPSRLVELIKSDQWYCPEDVSALYQISHIKRPETLTFDGLAGMQRETEACKRIARDERLAEIYGVRSSKHLASAISEQGFLDVDLAVMIAGNYDEEGLFLDYRVSLQDPRVVEGYWKSDMDLLRHREVAPSFNEFARALGLGRQPEWQRILRSSNGILQKLHGTEANTRSRSKRRRRCLPIPWR